MYTNYPSKQRDNYKKSLKSVEHCRCCGAPVVWVDGRNGRYPKDAILSEHRGGGLVWIATSAVGAHRCTSSLAEKLADQEARLAEFDADTADDCAWFTPSPSEREDIVRLVDEYRSAIAQGYEWPWQIDAKRTDERVAKFLEKVS